MNSFATLARGFANVASIAIVVLGASASLAATPQQDAIEYYQLHFGLHNPNDKLVDNEGNGDNALYGTRNVRAVLNGVVYRGGGNNAYNRHGIRNNQNPLPTEGLNNLCEEGFGQAVYLYTTRFGTAPKLVNCKSVRTGDHKLDYSQITALANPGEMKKILSLVNDRLQNPQSTDPIYLHCWNGWHASGYVSALILRQFCGTSPDEAVAYWNRNTDGVNKGSHYEYIRGLIRAFKPYSEFSISKELRDKICF